MSVFLSNTVKKKKKKNHHSPGGFSVLNSVDF